jgi:hypothetical protein
MPSRLPLALAGAFLIASPVMGAGKPDPRKYGWMESYSAAKAEAKRTGKPLFVVFRCDP